ncbi:SAM-dependent methyltransferase, MidA family [Actinopolymorpha cephalotaxi]|uniref:SAM-dependent MidA family methyltransferase n=1 Tax=Actinopolymorpha cephalotaxi TaxID=504797 RepID=A0A1I2NDY8_9ACTN|nr:SAM-dependent methyltransferase [Actinopolymorpha cephalotaxi]NYH85565.1 SAM-dependent MidA family methyltransferase [Actinopolymorpha cephalotaxi]SFG02064.1 SAM-dependent methyltransferase, MidA family [Actinopolymorpha cephalotaxi]
MGDARRDWRTWRAATEEALYGAEGFFRTQAPAAHFRTSVHVSPAFAAALARLARTVGARTVVDVGAGRGELLRALHDLDPGLRLVGVEVAERPAGLPEAVRWTADLPEEVDGLLVANEWLDDIPVDVAELDEARVPRLVEVDAATGDERLGTPVGEEDLAWLAEWWPLADGPPGARAEIGRPRDLAWAEVVRRLRSGLALAVDYGHVRWRRPPAGTLRGYRSGRPVAPVPDRSCDITAHVAVDSVARAGERAGAGQTVLTSQRAALTALGVDAARPPLALAGTDPVGYLGALSRAGEAAELVAPGGLGDFWWLAQTSFPGPGARAVDLRQALGEPDPPTALSPSPSGRTEASGRTPRSVG